MNPYTIAIAQPHELPAIVEIYNSTIASRQATADLHPVSVQDKQAWFDAHQNNRPLYVLKNQQNNILAWGSFSDYYPRLAYHITAEISIYVHQDKRGMGIGKIILQHMIEQAPQLGIRNIIGVIFGHNTASIRLFQSFGFTQWGKLPQVCELDTLQADIVLLGKRITPPHHFIAH